jgi:hypothetical protein
MTREVEAHGGSVAPRGWQNAEGEETSEGVCGMIFGWTGNVGAYGDALVKL